MMKVGIDVGGTHTDLMAINVEGKIVAVDKARPGCTGSPCPVHESHQGAERVAHRADHRDGLVGRQGRRRLVVVTLLGLVAVALGLILLLFTLLITDIP